MTDLDRVEAETFIGFLLSPLLFLAFAGLAVAGAVGDFFSGRKR